MVRIYVEKLQIKVHEGLMLKNFKLKFMRFCMVTTYVEKLHMCQERLGWKGMREQTFGN